MATRRHRYRRPDSSAHQGGIYRPKYVGRAYRLADPAISSAPPGSPIPFILSTPGLKRDGLNLATLPFTKDRYDRAPVVLFFHRYDQFSVGRGEIDIVPSRAGESLLATAWFDVDDPIGAEADRKYRAGYMFAVSLGWDDIDDRGVPVRASGRRAVARDILEFSVVSVPADPDALIDMTSEDVTRTRSFVSGVRALLPSGDARIPDFDDILRRLTECEGAECDVLLEAAGQRLDERRGFYLPGHLAQGDGDDPEASRGASPADPAEVTHHARGEADDVSGDTEARRRAAMAAMVAAVWVDDADEADDADREAARKSLLPEYRRLGLVPPAFLPASVVARVPPERRAWLLPNGELEELGMTTIIQKPASAADTSETGQRTGKTLSSSSRSTIEGAIERLDSARKSLRGLLDATDGERSAGERSCGCGSGSSHTPAQGVTQASGALAATTLDAELARLAELFPGVEFTASVPDGQSGARGLAGIESIQEAAYEGSQKSIWTMGTPLPDDVKQQIIDEVMSALPGAADQPVSISLSEWLQSEDPEWQFEPGTKAYFDFDLSPELAARIKAAALGLEQPAPAEAPATEELPAEGAPAEETPAEGGEVTAASATASAPAPDQLDADTLALFEAAAAGP